VEHESERTRPDVFAAGPWGGPSPEPPQPPAGAPPRTSTIRWTSIALFVLLLALFTGRAYRELSWSQSLAYWRDLYFSPSMTAHVVRDTEGHRPALAVSGKIGAAAAAWFRRQLDDAALAPGDLVLLSSPGGQLDQAVIMGEVVRARGLATAVGTLDDEGRIQPAYCASACVFVYAGGEKRIGIRGSKLGVHRFTTDGRGDDPVADTQRTTGFILGYFTRMGISPSIVEMMAATSDIRWLDTKEAAATKLVTEQR